MTHRGGRLAALATLLVLASGSTGADGPSGPPAAPKKVLVELYSSQGSRSSPAASGWLGGLEALGYGPDRVVALHFHVERPGDPWVDPYSDPAAARRLRDYGERSGRLDLPASTTLVVDGRGPLVNPSPSSALAALSGADRGPAGVALDLELTGLGARRSLSVRVEGRSPGVQARDLLVGVALAEGPLTTRVTSGENAGRVLVEHHVVRRFASKTIRLDGPGLRTLTFPVELVDARDAPRSTVAVFVQDRLDGTVHQAESIAWPTLEPSKGPASSRKKRHQAPAYVGPPAPDGWDALFSCADCGEPFSPEYLTSQPPGFVLNRFRFPNIPAPKC